MRKRAFIAFLSLLLVALFAVSVITLSEKTENQKIAASAKTYLVCYGKGLTREQAIKLSAEAKLRGGGGYVFLTRGYHVVLSAYQCEADADSVVKKLQAEDVYKMAIKMAVDSDNQGLIAAVEALSELSLSYDKGETSYADAILRLLEIKNELSRDVGAKSFSAAERVSRLNACAESAFSSEIKNTLCFLIDLAEKE